MTITVLLENFPDWAVPMTKLVPIYSTLDAYKEEDVSLGDNFFYDWVKLDNNHWQVTITVEGTFQIFVVGEGLLDIPTYVDLELVIVNERNFYHVQSNRS